MGRRSQDIRRGKQLAAAAQGDEYTKPSRAAASKKPAKKKTKSKSKKKESY